MSVDDVLAEAVPDHATLLAAVGAATRAPSVHNTQPWRWRFDGTRLRLYADPNRQLTAADPPGRQLVISCGVMLDHVRIAFAERGWHTDVTRLPDPARPEHLATITFRPWPDPPAAVRARAAAMARRRTDRLPLEEPENWTEILPALRVTAAAYRVDLDVLDESTRPRLAAAARRFGDLRGMDLLYETELECWTGHSRTSEGVPSSALVSDGEFARVGVGRVFPSTSHVTRRRAELADHSRLVVLSTARSTVTQWLRTGEALSAVLLRCTAAGLATCALTNITELPAGRDLLNSLIAHPGTPQVVLRVGKAPQDDDSFPPTPRRPLADILAVDEEHGHVADIDR